MKNNGSILIVVVFAIALLTAFVVGMLQLNSEQIQIMKNEIFSAQANAIAHAGLADAFSQLRTNSAWRGPATNSNFGGGSYTIIATGTLPNLDVNSIGISAQGFRAVVDANVTVSAISPSINIIRIDNLRINQ